MCSKRCQDNTNPCPPAKYSEPSLDPHRGRRTFSWWKLWFTHICTIQRTLRPMNPSTHSFFQHHFHMYYFSSLANTLKPFSWFVGLIYLIVITLCTPPSFSATLSLIFNVQQMRNICPLEIGLTLTWILSVRNRHDSLFLASVVYN